MNENDVVVGAWNTILFDKFVRFKHLLIEGLSGHSRELLSRPLFRPGDHVLDVACGTGIGARLAAPHVTPGGRVVGLDVDAGVSCLHQRQRHAVKDLA